MKKITMLTTIFIIVFLANVTVFLACTKEQLRAPIQQAPQAVRWGWVTHKYYTDSFPFVNPPYLYRRYWVEWTPDTVCPPWNPNCIAPVEKRRVRQANYDTLLRIPGQGGDRYPDTSFIPPYPY